MVSEWFSVQQTSSVNFPWESTQKPSARFGPWRTCWPGSPVPFPLANAVSAWPCFLQREEYHTHLAVLYLDEVLQHRPGASSKGAEVTETQAKLRHLLQKSDLYRVHFLMGEEDPDSFSINTSAGGWGARGERGWRLRHSSLFWFCGWFLEPLLAQKQPI